MANIYIVAALTLTRWRNVDSALAMLGKALGEMNRTHDARKPRVLSLMSRLRVLR